MAKNKFYSVKQTQRENFDGVFTERFLLPREVKKMCGIRHFRKTDMGHLRHLRRLRRFSPTHATQHLPADSITRYVSLTHCNQERCSIPAVVPGCISQPVDGIADF